MRIMKNLRSQLCTKFTFPRILFLPASRNETNTHINYGWMDISQVQFNKLAKTKV